MGVIELYGRRDAVQYHANPRLSASPIASDTVMETRRRTVGTTAQESRMDVTIETERETDGHWHSACAHDSGSNMNCRSSWAQRQPTAILDAHTSASSRDCTLSTQKPPLSMLVSG